MSTLGSGARRVGRPRPVPHCGTGESVPTFDSVSEDDREPMNTSVETRSGAAFGEVNTNVGFAVLRLRRNGRRAWLPLRERSQLVFPVIGCADELIDREIEKYSEREDLGSVVALDPRWEGLEREVHANAESFAGARTETQRDVRLREADLSRHSAELFKRRRDDGAAGDSAQPAAECLRLPGRETRLGEGPFPTIFAPHFALDDKPVCIPVPAGARRDPVELVLQRAEDHPRPGGGLESHA